MIAALLLAATIATPAPSPTLPPSMWSVRIASGPAVPRFVQPAHVPHDFKTLAAIAQVVSGRAPVALLSMPTPGPYVADAPATPAPFVPDLPHYEVTNCPNATPAIFEWGAQAFDAAVTANAIRHGSQPYGIFRARSAPALFAESIAFDYVVHGIFERHASCKAHAVTDVVLGGAALLNALHTEFPK